MKIYLSAHSSYCRLHNEMELQRFAAASFDTIYIEYNFMVLRPFTLVDGLDSLLHKCRKEELSLRSSARYDKKHKNPLTGYYLSFNSNSTALSGGVLLLLPCTFKYPRYQG